jgi:hypothetical protein
MDASLPRVMSVETRPCGNCGKELAVNTWADGSTSVVACDTCWPATEKASAAAAPVVREVATPAAVEEVAPSVEG